MVYVVGDTDHGSRCAVANNGGVQGMTWCFITAVFVGLVLGIGVGAVGVVLVIGHAISRR